MTSKAYYRALIVEALKTAASPLLVAELVESANAVGMDGGAAPRDVAGLTGRVASQLLRGLTCDGLVARVQPDLDASSALRYQLTRKARDQLPLCRTPPPPPFPRPIGVDVAAVRRTATPAHRKALQDEQQHRADAFCREFMDDTARLISDFVRQVDALRDKYQRRYRDARDG